MIKIIADFDKCEAFARCVDAAPDLFGINDENFVEIVDSSPAPDRLEAARKAVDSCPVRALSIVTE
ncbi:MAG: ferredoxin [Modestobacter sp.]|jgi:ferredoxin|nr:ferredoxin [Modestobacter sp.]